MEKFKKHIKDDPNKYHMGMVNYFIKKSYLVEFSDEQFSALGNKIYKFTKDFRENSRGYRRIPCVNFEFRNGIPTWVIKIKQTSTNMNEFYLDDPRFLVSNYDVITVRDITIDEYWRKYYERLRTLKKVPPGHKFHYYSYHKHLNGHIPVPTGKRARIIGVNTSFPKIRK
jgi:hypothetical protein